MEDSTNEVFQYYTIINDPEHALNQEIGGNSDQVVYLTIDQENDVSNITTESSSDCENNMQETSATSLSSDVKIITLGDGRMFMTSEDLMKEDNFEAVEPHLITCEANDSIKSEDDKSTENSSDTDYEIVQVVGNSSQMYQMIYCDVGQSTKEVKKEKSFICLYEGCGKMYSAENDLKVHMRSHSDSKPYVCTEEGCDKSFSTNYSLKAHIRTHTGEKPYACIVCQKCFKTSGDLQKHHRIHTGEKPFLCPIEGCGKSFTTSNIRKVHIRSHTGERPYACSYPDCGKAFSSSTNYKNHVRIHSGEKPFVCIFKDCGKRFTEYSSLYKHNLVHQCDRPFSCIFCEQKFKQESTLKLHKRVKHNVIVASDGREIIVNIN